jgi:hypothetical protein
MTENQRKPLQIPLERKGSWLISDSQKWQMHSVEGPLDWPQGDRQYFEVETASRERLLVSRRLGERGMRELRLDSILFRSALS